MLSGARRVHLVHEQVQQAESVRKKTWLFFDEILEYRRDIIT